MTWELRHREKGHTYTNPLVFKACGEWYTFVFYPPPAKQALKMILSEREIRNLSVSCGDCYRKILCIMSGEPLCEEDTE